MADVYYRVDGSSDLYIITLRVLKHTPCGVWVEQPYGGGRRFVRTDARKRYAAPTKAEALDSFMARKRRQLKILRAQMRLVEGQLAAIEAQGAELLRVDFLSVPRQLSEELLGG